MVKNNNSVFKPEYIFPQFLMQWMMSNEIDMIEYMSTKINYSAYKNSISFMTFNNIAIPAKSSKESGVCEILKKLIKVTNPISWQSLLIMNPK